MQPHLYVSSTSIIWPGLCAHSVTISYYSYFQVRCVAQILIVMLFFVTEVSSRRIIVKGRVAYAAVWWKLKRCVNLILQWPGCVTEFSKMRSQWIARTMHMYELLHVLKLKRHLHQTTWSSKDLPMNHLSPVLLSFPYLSKYCWCILLLRKDGPLEHMQHAAWDTVGREGEDNDTSGAWSDFGYLKYMRDIFHERYIDGVLASSG